MQVPTTNIILTYSKDTITRLATGRDTLASILAYSKKVPDTLVFNNLSNNFISLTHEYLYNDKGFEGQAAAAPSIVLEIIDPENIFEEKFIANSLRSILNSPSKEGDKELKRLQDLLGDPSNPSKEDFITKIYGKYLPPDLKEVKDTITQFAKEVEDLQDFEDALDFVNPEERPNYAYQQRAKLSTINQDLYKKALQKWESENIYLHNRIQERIQELTKTDSTKLVYIMYGIGDNASQWAGPFMSTLTGASYNFAGATGYKSVTLTFLPNGEWPELNYFKLHDKGFQTLIEAREAVVVNDKPDTKLSDYTVMDKARLGVLFKNIRPSPVRDFHKVMVSCIKKYLIKCTNNKANVIVILPNINKVCAPLIDSASKLYDITYANDFILAGNQPTRIAFIVDKLFRALGFQLATGNLALPEQDVNHTINLLRGDGVDGFSEDKLGNTESFTDGAIDQFISGLSPLDPRRIDSLKLPEKANVIEVVMHKGENEGAIEPINRVTEGLRSNGQVYDNVLQVIDDFQFIREFEIYLKSKDFSLNNSKKEKFSSNKPILIYGDSTLIQRYFFGKRYLEGNGLFKYNFDTVNIDKDTINIPLEDLLSPLDELFSTKEYLDLAIKYFVKYTNNATYDFESLPTGTFSFLPTAEQQLKRANLPVFKYGVQNPNVLDINFNFNTFYFAFLNSVGFREDFLQRSSNSVIIGDGSDLNALDSVNKDTLTNAVRQYLIVTDNGRQVLKQEARNAVKKNFNLNDSDVDTLGTIVAAIATSKTRTNSITHKVEWWGSGNAFTYILWLLGKASGNMLNGTVRTLPAYNLSRAPESMPPALLFVSEPKIMGIHDSNSLLRLLNGFWKIFGFQHKISATDCYSNFHLIKDLRLEGSHFMVPNKPKTEFSFTPRDGIFKKVNPK